MTVSRWVIRLTACAWLVWLASSASAAGEAGSPSDAAKAPEAKDAPAAAAPKADAKAEDAPAAAKPVDPIEDFIQKTKQPVPWFNWGADFRFRDEYYNNVFTLNKNDPARERNYLRYRPRWWGTITPVKGIDLNGRLVWEGRYYTKPDHHLAPANQSDWDQGEVMWDNLNLRLTDIGGSGLSATVGRQDLKYGEGWLVTDGTPRDGSRTTYFDAYKLSYEAKPIQTTFDAVFIHNKADPEDDWLRNLKDLDLLTIEQDQNGFLFYVSNKSLPKTRIDAFYIYKDETARMRGGDDGYLHTFGASVGGDLAEHWQYRAEGAHQFGQRNGRTAQACGLNGWVAYLFREAGNNRLRTTYEFLSGDDPDSRTDEQFDPLWGRWPLWSELWAYHQVNEMGRYAYTTNLHRLAFGWAVVPVKRTEFLLDYHLLWADENTLGATAAGRRRGFSRTDSFRGQLVTARLKFDICKHLSGHLLGEFFFPGDAYLKNFNDPATFLRSELVFTW